MRSLGEWMFDSFSAKPVRIGGDATGGERGDERDRAARADEQRPHPEHLLERVEAELDGGRVGGHETGRRVRPAPRISTSAPVRRRLAEEPLEGAG